MSTFAYFPTFTRRLAVALALLIANVTAGADVSDPTAASQSIREKLRSANEVDRATQPAAAAMLTDEPVLRLRLRGIVLRDEDHGTALISHGDNDMHVVTLRRADPPSATVPVNIGGIRLEVKDFSGNCVIMRRLDTNEQLIIN